MPYLHITLSTPASTRTAHQVIELLTDLTANILRKKRELTAVRVEFADPQLWAIGSMALAGQPHNSFYLDAKVTDGTNTPDEKTRYIAQVFSGLESMLGPLAAASYTVLHEVPAQSWGYQGRTQAARSGNLVVA
ncbi:4-oxalocrotonate tautomerase family protein [Rhodoferax sp.]|uniref:tautomerase family protein n=1 Tax=Rhodoferax sp. TaxID=50421 RepID=UPI00374D934D